ncbi:MAG: NAD(P)/FAD-dependent oxidoreductase [Bacillota bacterium]
MRYRISQLKTDPRDAAGVPPEELLEKAVLKEIARRTRRDGGTAIRNLEIIRESVDARKKPDVKLVYTVDFDCDGRLPFDVAKREEYVGPSPVGEPDFSEGRPVVVGFGPCGIFAALILAEAGLRPVVIERGKAVGERVADVERFWADAKADGAAAPDPESNVQFGEGGAGTFSDGKLTTGIKDVRIRKVLEEFVEGGADPEILYRHRPHIGTDRLRVIVPEIRRKIERLGGEVRFSTRLDGFEFEGGRLKGIKVNRRSGETESEEMIETGCAVLAIGHSARDTFEMLRERGFEMEKKPFSIGVRIEHPQKMISESQYGDPQLAEILGPADYKMSYRCEGGAAAGRGVYTFCMCPGGQVINASTEDETSVTNGMSESGRSGEYANSGLLVDVRTEDFPGDDPLAGVEFQKKYERLAWENRTEAGMARSDYGRFRDSGEDPVRKSIPAFASEAIIEAMPAFGRKIKGFDREDARLTAVESRSSSPVRVRRDENMEAPGFAGVMPAGEGPGYAGGIMSAAVDGIRAAEKIIISGKYGRRSV